MGKKGDNDMSSVETIRGRITALDNKFPRPSMWQWFRVSVKEGRKKKLCHVSGISSTYIAIGMDVVCDVESKGYNSQYDVHEYKLCADVRIADSTDAALIRKSIVDYLASGDFQYIGRSTALRLYDAFGAQVFDMIQSDMDLVCKKVKLTERQKESLCTATISHALSDFKKAFPHLSDTAAQEVVHHFKQNHLASSVVNHYKKKPFDLRKFKSVRFDMLDNVLIYDVGLPLFDFNRLAFVFEHSVRSVMKKTHNTYISTQEEWDLLTKFSFQRPMPVPYTGAKERGKWVFEMMCLILKKHLDLDVLRKDVRDNRDLHVYTKSMFDAKISLERILENYLAPSVQTQKMWGKFYKKSAQLFQSWVFNCSPNLTDEQSKAMLNTVSHSLSFISGGPGRGKTYVAKYLLEFWQSCISEHVLLLAPTGRAVNKLKADTGYSNVETIARCHMMNLGNRNPQTFIGNNNEVRPTGTKTLVVIDEVSMLDLYEAVNIFNMFKDCTVVFLGDVNQLQPIEPGSFLHTILEIHKVYPFPMSYLTKNLRANKQVLSDNADKILDGTLSGKDYHSDFVFDFTFAGVRSDGTLQTKKDVDEITRQKAVSYYQDALKNGFSYSDILLISPTRKDAAGVNALNESLQDELNPVSSAMHTFLDKKYRKCMNLKGMVCPNVLLNGRELRILDRVMYTVNNPKFPYVCYEDDDPDSGKIREKGTGVYNGDTGTVVRYIYPEKKEIHGHLMVQMDDGRFFEFPCEREFLKDLTLAYAITVHKSQGSEAACVLVVLPEELVEKNKYMTCSLLTQNLLYTAVTRAKDSVQIIGSKLAMDACLSVTQDSGACTVGEDVIRYVSKNINSGAWSRKS